MNWTMNERITQGAQVAAEIAAEIANSPKTATLLSGYILGVHWLDALSEAFKWSSSAMAFIVLCLVISNHLLVRKKLKLEIQQLKDGK